MKLFVGLGNPGKQYEHTRHNVGFRVIDQLSKDIDIPLDKQNFNGIFGMGTIGEEKIILLKPLTYMNLSGESVKPLMNFYKISPEEVLVVYDDLDIPTGKLRLRTKGSAGGHNGIKSLIHHLSTEQFNRLRIGIDRPMRGIPVPNYVLGTFSGEDEKKIEDAILRSAKACQDWITKPFLEVMNTHNQ